MISKVLSGHYSESTAYVVDDYPCGWKTRCKIRYWLEVNNRGTRFLSQTTNPRITIAEVWNKPKPSTYSLVGAMYLNEDGHCKWDSISLSSVDKASSFLSTYRDGLTEEQIKRLENLTTLYQQKKDSDGI